MEKLRLFISYASEDRPFLDQLLKHLSTLVSDGLVEPWTDRALHAGDRWDDEIRAELDAAHIVLLLVSADFLASKYIAAVEMARALEREKRREAVVVPVILRFADWQSAPFHYLQALPEKGKPVTDWRNRDEAYLNIVTGLRAAIARLRASPGGTRPPAAGDVATAEPETVRQDRVLDAAIAAKIPLAKPSDLTVMVRKADSSGLKAILLDDDEFTATPEDVKSKPFQVEFGRDANGKLRAERLTVKIEAPDFDPPAQSDEILVPPDRDSDVCTFLMRPLYPGELVIKLKVFAQNGAQAMRLMRIFSEASDRVIEGGRVIASIPIATVAGAQTAAPDGSEFPVSAHAPAPPQPPVVHPSAAPSPRKAPELGRDIDPRILVTGRPPKKSRRWVLPAASGVAAMALIGTAIVQFGPLASSPNVRSRNSPLAVNLPVKPPPAPPPALVEASRSPASEPSDRPGAATDRAWRGRYQTGVSAAKGGDYTAAVQDFQRAIEIAPAESAPKYALAVANLQLADKAEGVMRQKYLNDAIVNATQAVVLKPDSAQALYVMGLALEKNGQFAEAEQPLRRAAELTPNNGEAWYALGLALDKQKKTGEAAAALGKAVEIDPANTNARLLLAASLAKDDPVLAKKHLVILMNDSSLPEAERKATDQLHSAMAARGQ